MPYPRYWRPWITPKEESKELVTPDLDLKVVGMDDEVLATESLTTETQERQHIHEFGEEFEQVSYNEKKCPTNHFCAQILDAYYF